MKKPTLGLPETIQAIELHKDGRMQAPSATRNSTPIFKCLAQYVPASGMALELASGTGQHIAELARMYPDIDWQPSEVSPDRMASIEAWRSHCGAANLRPPIYLDASDSWQGAPTGQGLITVVNLFHLIPQDMARRVISGAARALAMGGHFFIYGPFRVGGMFRSEGDAEFHTNLQRQDAATGYKDLEWMEKNLTLSGLEICGVHEMPANNLAVVAKRSQ